MFLVAFCLLFGGCSLLAVVCCIRLLFVVCYPLGVGCWLMCVMCCVRCVCFVVWFELVVVRCVLIACCVLVLLDCSLLLTRESSLFVCCRLFVVAFGCLLFLLVDWCGLFCVCRLLVFVNSCLVFGVLCVVFVFLLRVVCCSVLGVGVGRCYRLSIVRCCVFVVSGVLFVVVNVGLLVV